MLAVSTLLAFRPSATVSQVRAIASRASSPRAASHLSGLAVEW
jgi:hypothetical protein